MKAVYRKQRNEGHKGLVPRSPTFFSTNGGPLTGVTCPHLLAFWVFRVTLAPGFVVADT